jgi:hypothetical protein
MTNFTEILFLYLFFGPLCNFLLALACLGTSDVQCLRHYGSSFTHGLQFRNSVQEATSLTGAERNDGFSREVIVLQECVDDGRVSAPPPTVSSKCPIRKVPTVRSSPMYPFLRAWKKSNNYKWESITTLRWK